MDNSKFDWQYLKDEVPPPDTEVWVYVMTNLRKPVTRYTYIPKIVDHAGKKFPAKWISQTDRNRKAQPEHQWKLYTVPKPPTPDFTEPCKHPQRDGRHEDYFDDRPNHGNQHYCRACGAICSGCEFCSKLK